MALKKTHPYWFLFKMAEDTPEIIQLSFSHYKYAPQSLVDERINTIMSRDDFLNVKYMNDFLSSGPQDVEISINSPVLCLDGTWRHIPMVDMSTSATAHLIKLNEFLEETIFSGFSWFDSGRSFHGYGNRLVEHEEWIELMGTLLLSNQKGMAPLVDPRWIGHRLIAGYSALRWTKRTAHYIDAPAQLKVPLARQSNQRN